MGFMLLTRHGSGFLLVLPVGLALENPKTQNPTPKNLPSGASGLRLVFDGWAVSGLGFRGLGAVLHSPTVKLPTATEEEANSPWPDQHERPPPS